MKAVVLPESFLKCILPEDRVKLNLGPDRSRVHG